MPNWLLNGRRMEKRQMIGSKIFSKTQKWPLIKSQKDTKFSNLSGGFDIVLINSRKLGHKNYHKLSKLYRGAGYKTLLMAVYKTSLFFGGSEVAAYKTSLFFRSPKWLSIKPYFSELKKTFVGLFMVTFGFFSK